MNLIPAQSNTFEEIDHEIFSSHSPPSTASRRVSYKRKHVQEVYILVNSFVKLAQEKVLFLFDLILYVPSIIFQLNRTDLPGLNQY